MIRHLPVLIAFFVVLAIPFVLKPTEDLLSQGDDHLIIVTPHNEAIRYEFSVGFARYYQEKTGRTVSIDWRTPGGTSEITMFLASEFQTAFQIYWQREIGKSWGSDAASAHANHSISLAAPGEEESFEQEVRRTFLESDIGIGIDLFFGGGSFEFIIQSRAGRLVDSGILQRHPDWFGPRGIPQRLGAEEFYDVNGTWVGTCLSAFGICYNEDVIARLALPKAPDQWSDLGSPELFGQLALADPTKSGSIAKAFEMLIQQQMQRRLAAGASPEQAAAKGWEDGLRIIQRMGGNARYFTDSASKIVVDVALGDAGAGMCIDFYGRQQSEAVADETGESRMKYLTPLGGSSVGVDPIGLLRGAPNREVAIHFIDFVMSLEGQKLWNFEPDSPGGPQRYALRRPPVRPELYSAEFNHYRSDPQVMPYDEALTFDYRPEWTGPYFGVIRFVIRAMCLDPHDELRAAWRALVEAGMPEEALARFHDLSPLAYEGLQKDIREVLSQRDPIAEVQLAKKLSDHFRQAYRDTIKICQDSMLP